MRYPQNSHRAELKRAQEEARQRESELAAGILDGDLDEDEGDFDGL